MTPIFRTSPEESVFSLSHSLLPIHSTYSPDQSGMFYRRRWGILIPRMYEVFVSGEQECGSHRQGMDETHGGLLDGDGFDFLEGGQTLQALLDAVLHQRGHPVFKGGIDHLFRFSFCLNQSLQFVRP
jgi:hypothetical protein